MQNIDFWTRITSLCGPQTCPFVLCMYNSVLSIRNTCLYWSQTSSVVFACKTARLAPELLVSMVPRPHLWILIAKQRLLDQHTCLYGYQTSPVVLCIQNSDLRTKIARLYGSQTSSVNLCMKNSMLSISINSLYGSQPSCVVFGCKTATFGLE